MACETVRVPLRYSDLQAGGKVDALFELHYALS